MRRVAIIGGGHNGLVCAAYLAKAGLDVSVFERRHILGGAAVTEELLPGYKFSRASYLAGLLRPQIIKDLELEKRGFEYIPRSPSSFTPTKPEDPVNKGKYLMLGTSAEEDWKSIAQFSERDADAFVRYEDFLGQVRSILQPFIDDAPPDITEGKLAEKMKTLSTLSTMIKVGYKNRQALVPFYELFTGPAQTILDRWFESDILKTTLATDAVIGAMISPKMNGSAYVLLHHVMGEAAGKRGVWSYVRGGMGAVSDAIAAAARASGAALHTGTEVRRILYEGGRVRGLLFADGSRHGADIVIAGCSPHHTFFDLCKDADGNALAPRSFLTHLQHSDLSCGSFKINCAIDRLPDFTCIPSSGGAAGPQHRGTVHFVSRLEEIEAAYREASAGVPATRPVIEMTIPSSLDDSLAPAGKHVAQLFVQFAPYRLDAGQGAGWADPAYKQAFVSRCFNVVEEFCPGFSGSLVGVDALSPLDLERVFGLPGGNLSHISLGIHQLAYTRPAPGYSSYRMPLRGLYLCGAGAHPGGGVQGAGGRNCSSAVLSDLNSV